MNKEQVEKLRDELIADEGKGASPLAVKFEPYLRDKSTGTTYEVADLAMMKKRCKDFIQATHLEAITRLRKEIRKDPFNFGYKGQTSEKIQELLTQERKIEELQEFVIKDEVTGKETTRRVLVVVSVEPPPISRIWEGVPYARNLPTLDNIDEAR